MKTQTAKHLLGNLSHNPLQIIGPDDIANVLEPFQSVDHHGSRGGSRQSAFTNLHSSQSGFFKIPMTPLLKKTSYSLRVQKTPPCKKQRLINLSFSQPSSPKTPLLGASRDCSTPHLAALCKTPSISADFVPCTPMIINPLQVLNQTNNAIVRDNLDILQLIDDDCGSVEVMESKMKMYTETELTDESVVDYLLDLGQEHQKENTQHKVHKPKPNHVLHERPRRKCRHAKPVTKEEKRSLERLQREKAKEKRRQRRAGLQTKETKATRKSNRQRRPVQRFAV